MGRLRKYVLAGALAGATALGAYVLLRDAPVHNEILDSKPHVYAEENRPVEVKTPSVKEYTREEKIEETAPVVVKEKPKFREMPSFLEEILTRPEFNNQFIDTFSAQLERLLVLCPKWRKADYVTSHEQRSNEDGASVRVEYFFEGMSITESQRLFPKKNYFTGKNAGFRVDHDISLRIKRPNGGDITLDYSLPSENDSSINATNMFDKDGVHNYVSLSLSLWEKPDSRDTYPVHKVFVQKSAAENKAAAERFLKQLEGEAVDAPIFSKNTKELTDENLEHNYQERVSGRLIRDLQSGIVGNFADFLRTLPKKE
ncbi:MAG: hypothetical protein AABY16_03480 [Nanoarchaeota archaeon]